MVTAAHRTLLTLTLAILSPCLPSVLQAAQLRICASGCPHARLSDGLHAARDGDTLLVLTGTYREHNLAVNKSVTLRGEGWPVLDGAGQGEILLISAPNVHVRGFVVANTGFSYLEDRAGIRVSETRDCRISGNRFRNTTYAVYLAKSENCTVDHNDLVGTGLSESESGNGIHIWSGQGHRLLDNRVRKHRDGIYFEFVKDSQIERNDTQDNVRYGLHFMFSDNDSYRDNVFANNGAGVAVMYSKSILMENNRFEHNRGSAAYGLLLKEISASRIVNNHFHDNTVGVLMEGSNRSQFDHNLFSGNGFALRVLGDCENNTFTLNNFQGNTFEVSTNSDSNNNTFTGNYWGDYQGYDLNRDGTGDIPHRPVSLAAVILERVDSSFVLLRSFLFGLLDQAERAFPELISRDLRDDHPRMIPVGGVGP